LKRIIGTTVVLSKLHLQKKNGKSQANTKKTTEREVFDDLITIGVPELIFYQAPPRIHALLL